MGADATSAGAEPGRADRFFLAIVVGAFALIVVSVAAVAAPGLRGATTPPDPASPVGVVHGFTTAARAGDLPLARSYLSRAAQGELDRARSGEKLSIVDARRDSEQRVVVTLVSESPDQALVRVTFTTYSARVDLFSSGAWHRSVDVRLIREAEIWRIAWPIDPMSLAY
ncbi:MAG: hypothetical protein FJ033_05465 [Chloroflexi bacterium]|nr:hypothetical protein [Chloroflexota bacterium]